MSSTWVFDASPDIALDEFLTFRVIMGGDYKHRLGDCYENAANFALAARKGELEFSDRAHPDLVADIEKVEFWDLVHGRIENAEGVGVDHAWVVATTDEEIEEWDEDGDYTMTPVDVGWIYEPTTDVVYPAEYFNEHYHPTERVRYSFVGWSETLLEHGHYGPWDKPLDAPEDPPRKAG